MSADRAPAVLSECGTHVVLIGQIVVDRAPTGQARFTNCAGVTGKVRRKARGHRLFRHDDRPVCFDCDRLRFPTGVRHRAWSRLSVRSAPRRCGRRPGQWARRSDQFTQHRADLGQVAGAGARSWSVRRSRDPDPKSCVQRCCKR